jgi:uncharacterized protein
MSEEVDTDGSAGIDWFVPPLVTVLVAAAFWFGGSRSGQGLLIGLGALYALLGAFTVWRLRGRDEMRLLKPRAGDFTFAALVAGLLYGLAFVFHALVTSPGEPKAAWVMRVYMLLGDPLSPQRYLVGAAAAVIGLLEELTWRGLVTPALESRLGLAKGNLAGVLLYAAAHIPTMWLLGDPTAGLNPLLVLASLGCGTAWSYLRWRMERLPPVLLSHALFSWAIVEFPLWR